MSEDEKLKQNIQAVVSICATIVSLECDEINFFRGADTGKTTLVFGAKYRGTFTPYYELGVVNKCQLQHPDKDTVSFVGCPPDDMQHTLTDLLLNQVVALVVFNIETFALTVKFDDGLILTLPNDSDGSIGKRYNYQISRNVSPHPLGGRGTEFYITGKKIVDGFWIS